MPLNKTKLKYGNMMKLKAYEKIMWMIELVQYITSDQRVLCTLGCTFYDAIDERLLPNKFFTRNQIKIFGHVAKYLCKCYTKV